MWLLLHIVLLGLPSHGGRLWVILLVQRPGMFLRIYSGRFTLIITIDELLRISLRPCTREIWLWSSTIMVHGACPVLHGWECWYTGPYLEVYNRLRQPIANKIVEHRFTSLMDYYASTQLAEANIEARNVERAQARNTGSSRKMTQGGGWQASGQPGGSSSTSSESRSGTIQSVWVLPLWPPGPS